MKKAKKVVVILSGGMDSALCATMALKDGYEVVALHFDYAQRTQNREKIAFNEICDRLNIKERLTLDVSFIASIGGSALTDKNILVPKDGLKSGVPVTYVPYRNGIFISVAAALAEKIKASAIFIGVVQADSSGYPDCRADFIAAAQKAINLGTALSWDIELRTPLVGLSKAEIVLKSIELGSPLEATWSCYENETKACGKCDSCRLRLRGFERAGVKDPIAYASKG